MSLLEDAVKLFYGKRYLSAVTLAEIAVKLFAELADMKVFEDNPILPFGLSLSFEKKYIPAKGKELTKEVADERLLIIRGTSAIFLAVTCYRQINRTLPPDKTILKFYKEYMNI